MNLFWIKQHIFDFNWPIFVDIIQTIFDINGANFDISWQFLIKNWPIILKNCTILIEMIIESRSPFNQNLKCSSES